MMATRAWLTSARSTGVENLDDLLNRSCPPCRLQPGRVYTKHSKPDTLTTLPRPRSSANLARPINGSLQEEQTTAHRRQRPAVFGETSTLFIAYKLTNAPF
jgi:hypothetical protein